jgi:hypothetical protein
MTSKETTSVQRAWKDRRTMLSAAWVFLLLNFIYADVFGLVFDPAMKTSDMNGGAILFFAVVMEMAIAMTFASRLLPRAWNRWANMGFAVVHIALLGWTLVDGPTTSFYKFFAIIEIATLLFIMGYAWTWRPQRAVEPVALGAAA